MISSQILPSKVTDRELVEVMSRIPREIFLPGHLQGLAYTDGNIALGNDRHMMAPVILARLLQAAGVQKTDTVLDIGCGTGYCAAILGRMAKSVIGLESDKNMATEGVQLLDGLGIKNVTFVHQGDLHQGYARKSPFNVILINGGVPAAPEKIKSQLAEGGRLVTIISRHARTGSGMLITRHNGSFSTQVLFDAATPALAGFEEKRGFLFS